MGVGVNSVSLEAFQIQPCATQLFSNMGPSHVKRLGLQDDLIPFICSAFKTQSRHRLYLHLLYFLRAGSSRGVSSTPPSPDCPTGRIFILLTCSVFDLTIFKSLEGREADACSTIPASIDLSSDHQGVWSTDSSGLGILPCQDDKVGGLVEAAWR